MGKGHRDNHAARLKRGAGAFAKKADRRSPASKCNLCGRACRAEVLWGGLCPSCTPRNSVGMVPVRPKGGHTKA